MVWAEHKGATIFNGTSYSSDISVVGMADVISVVQACSTGGTAVGVFGAPSGQIY